jgi:hypothetical protein
LHHSDHGAFLVFLVCCLVTVTQTLSVPTCVCLEGRLASVTGVSR